MCILDSSPFVLRSKTCLVLVPVVATGTIVLVPVQGTVQSCVTSYGLRCKRKGVAWIAEIPSWSPEGKHLPRQ